MEMLMTDGVLRRFDILIYRCIIFIRYTDVPLEIKRIRSCCKVDADLAVIPRCERGHHDITSVYPRIGLGVGVHHHSRHLRMRGIQCEQRLAGR